MLDKQTSVYLGGFCAAGLVAVFPMIIGAVYLYPIAIVCALGLACSIVIYFSDAETKKPTKLHTSFPDVRAADSAAIRNMMSGPERKKLVGLLKSGEVSAWSMMQGCADLELIRSDSWRLRTLRFIEIDGKSETLFAKDHEMKRRPWGKKAIEPERTQFYDVHFNRAQLSAIWPDIKF